MATKKNDAEIKNNRLTEKIEWILRERGLTHEKLAEQGGFATRTQVSQILRRLRDRPGYSHSMSFENYVKLAQGGRVSMQWLLGLEDNPDGKGTIHDSKKFPNLAVCLQYEGSRWATSTITAAYGLELESDPDPKMWTQILDGLEKTIATVQMEANRAKKEKSNGR